MYEINSFITEQTRQRSVESKNCNRTSESYITDNLANSNDTEAKHEAEIKSDYGNESSRNSEPIKGRVSRNHVDVGPDVGHRLADTDISETVRRMDLVKSARRRSSITVSSRTSIEHQVAGGCATNFDNRNINP